MTADHFRRRPCMTLSRMGGLAALICGATYVVGFVLLVTVLAPLNYGSARIDPAAVVDFIHARPGVMIAWNTTIYLVNAVALAVVVVALAERIAARPGWAAVSRAFGLVWIALVFAAGMIANVTVERAAILFPQDPVAAADFWATLHAVELGLGGGNEIAGGVWIGCASVAALNRPGPERPVMYLGLFTGLSGLATVVPAFGDTAGAIFGLGAIIWFLAIGSLLAGPRRRRGK